jgi:hypothetical protein
MERPGAKSEEGKDGWGRANLGEIIKEAIPVLGVDLDPLFELSVLDESVVRRQHHELLLKDDGLILTPSKKTGGASKFGVSETCKGQVVDPKRKEDRRDNADLERSIPFLWCPLAREEQLKVLVREPSRVRHPRSFKAGSIAVASSEIVRSRECNDLLVWT